jgi:hypothetical protein
MTKPTVKNYKTAYKEALIAYTQKRRQASVDDYWKAMARDESVAEEEQQYLVDIDFSTFYNLGITYDQIMHSKEYRQWVKDWGLPEPTGERPKELFHPYFDD